MVGLASLDILINEGKSYREKLSVFVDGELFCYLHPTIFGRKIKLEAENIDQLREKLKALELSGAKRYILKRLSEKSYHSLEISKLLKDKDISKDVIESLLVKCKEWGFINDEQWLESYIFSLKRQKRGDRLIAMKLKGKGLDDRDIYNALESLKDHKATASNIHRLLDSRYRSRDLGNLKEKNKVIASLMRQGFNYSDIAQVLNDRAL